MRVSTDGPCEKFSFYSVYLGLFYFSIFARASQVFVFLIGPEQKL